MPNVHAVAVKEVANTRAVKHGKEKDTLRNNTDTVNKVKSRRWILWTYSHPALLLSMLASSTVGVLQSILLRCSDPVALQ
jgi:hypothetical protein